MNHSSRSIFAVLAFFSISILPQVAISKTYAVNVFEDPAPDISAANGCDNAGRCSLREAVYAAGVNGDTSSTINLPAGTYLLTINGNDDTGVAGDLDILNHSLTITGTEGADKTIIDASALNDRAFDYPVPAGATVIFNGLTIKGGNPSTHPNSSGGAIYFNGAGASDVLEINSCLITSNKALNAGGIYTSKSKTTINNSTISENDVTANSGSQGGGIFVYETTVAINNSTISGNRAGGYGGGISIIRSSVPALLRNVTLFNNSATNGAGGLHLTYSKADITNSILFGNKGFADADTNCTQNTSSTFTSNGYNIFGGFGLNGCITTGPATNDNTTGDPGLQPIANNGGPTPTHLLNAGSIAINVGNPAGCKDNTGADLTKDQRGLPRPGVAGERCDIGAVEIQPVSTGTGTGGTGSGSGSGSGSGTPASGGSTGCSFNANVSNPSITSSLLLILMWGAVGGWVRFRKNN